MKADFWLKMTNIINLGRVSRIMAVSLFMTIPLTLTGQLSVDFTVSSSSVCSGSSINIIDATTGITGTPTYTWSFGNGSSPSTADLPGPHNITYTGSGVSTISLTVKDDSGEKTVQKDITIIPQLPVSVSILPSVNPVCSGTSVTFTANPVNGGTTPAYQWKVNNIAVGTNAATYAYSPANGDLVKCELTSSETCVSGNPASSNVVTMTVNTPLPVSVSVAPSANSVCSGTSVTFTATPLNGGSTPTYQWKVNGLNAGSGGSSYSYAPVNGDQVTCVLNSSDACVSGNPATSNTVNMIVNTPLPVSVSVVASANPVCSGTSVNFTATPVNGGATPAYQWKVNGGNVGTGSATYSYTPVNGDIVTCVLSSSDVCVSGNPATSNSVTMSVNASLPVSVSIVPSSNPVCSGTSVTFTATPVNGGLNPAYQWKVNNVNAGTNSHTFSSSTLNNNDIVTVVLTSDATCSTGSPASSNQVTMNVNPNLPASVSIAASPSGAVCSGTIVTFTATPVNGGLLPVYQWKVNGVNVGTGGATYSYAPVNGDLVSCILTSNATCATGSPATSNVITMAVNANVTAGVSISSNANPVCSGTSVTFTATPVNGGALPAYQWYVNSIAVGTSLSSYTYVPAANDAVSCIMTSNAVCAVGNPATSNVINMAINSNLPASVTIAASANNICAGTSVTFTATPVNGGTTPSYQWYLNGLAAGTNSQFYSHVSVNGDVVYCVMTSSELCATGSPATSGSVTMNVTPTVGTPTAPLLSASEVCQATAGITCSSTATNATSYNWSITGTGNSVSGTGSTANITLDPAFSGTAVVSVTASGCSGPSASSSANLVVRPTPSASISGTVTVCQNAASPFVSITNPTLLPITVTYNVNGGGAQALNIAASSTSTVSVPTNVAGVLNYNLVSVVYQTAPSCTAVITGSAVVTVTGTVGTPALPSTASTTLCQGAGATVFTTSATDATSYNWSVTGTGNTVSGTGTSATVTWAPAFSGTAMVSVTANGCNGPSASSSVMVTIRPTPVVTISGTTEVCQNGSSPLITFTNPMTLGVIVKYNINGSSLISLPINGSSSTTISAPTSVAGIFNYNLDNVVYQLTPECSSPLSGSAAVTVNPLPVPVLVSSDDDNSFCAGTSVTFSAGGGALYNFRVGGSSVQSGSSNTYTTSALSNGKTVDVIVTSSAGCIATSASITNFVDPLPFIFITTPAACSPDLSTYNLSVAVSSGIVTSTSGVVTSIGGNVWNITGVPTGTNITVRVTDGNSCENFLSVTAPNCSCPVIQAPVSGGDKSYCPYDYTPSLTATVKTGETVDWYNAASGGTILSTNTNSFIPDTPGTYYAMARNIVSGCVSSTRTAITLTMNGLPVPAIVSSDADNTFCYGTPVTFTATGGTKYNFRLNGNSVQSGTSATYTSSTLTNGSGVDVVVTNESGCIAVSTAIYNSVNEIPSASIISSDADNRICAGAPVTFYASGGNSYNFRVGGTSVQSGSLTFYTTSTLTNGQIVDVIVSAAGCSSTSPSITNEILPLPVPTIKSSDADNIFCEGSLITFTGTGGANYDFLVNGDSKQGGAIATYSINTLENGDKVSVTVTSLNGCSVTSSQITNTVYQNPVSNAGSGGSKCDLIFNLSAVPSIGTGTWTKTSGPGTATFSPNPNTPNATVTVTESGAYVFTWTEFNNICSSSSNVTVNFYKQPVSNPGTGGNNCGPEFQLNAVPSVGLGTWSKSSGPGSVSFSPDSNTPNAIVSVSAFGQYTLTWTEVNGTCSNSASVNVNFLKIPSANAGDDATSCDLFFNLAAVKGTGTGTWTKYSGPGDALFSPDIHQATAMVTVSMPGEYEFQWAEVNSTCQSSDRVKVVFYGRPEVTAGNDTTICEGSFVNLKAKGTGAFSWEPAALLNDPNLQNPIATPAGETTFKVTLTSWENGCKSTDSLKVSTVGSPEAKAGADQTLEYLFVTSISATPPGPGESGFWSLVMGAGKIDDPADPDINITNLAPGENIFLWTVSNGVCPSSLDFVTINVNDFKIPTLITPNMDGKNDYFVLKGLETLGKTEINIFDRRGVKVFSNSDYDNQWNGVDMNGDPLPADTYFYTLKSANGKSLSGYIVIR